jgi:hypothetical protein
MNKYDLHRSINNLSCSENCLLLNTKIIKSTSGVKIMMNKKGHLKMALKKYLNTQSFTGIHNIKNDFALILYHINEQYNLAISI